MYVKSSFSSLFLAWLLCCTGCGSSQEVEGTITLDGQPMSGVQVLFDRPELSVRENKGFVGRTNNEGKYKLTPAFDQGTAVPPGKYRVSLTTAVFDPSEPVPQAPSTSTSTPFYPESPPPPPERIPPAYRGGKLTFTVPEGGTDQADFELKSK
jgi:hypothetical protein